MNWGDSGQGSNGGGGSPNRQNGAAESAEAAALAARLALVNAYDNGGNAASSGTFLGAYAVGQPSTAAVADPERAAMFYAQAQRSRELEMFQLQQQMQERQVLENEARNRLLEHAARNQLDEYERTQLHFDERTRVEMALAEEIQIRDRARRAAENELAVAAILSSHQQELDALNAGARSAQERHRVEQQLRELIANHEAGVSDNNNTNNEEGDHAASGFQIASSTTAIAPTTNNSNTTKDELQQKKKPSPKKESPTKKDATKKSTSPKRKKSPQKEGTSSKVPVHISTSLSHLDSKVSPVKAKSSSTTPTKKRKKAPSKASSSGGAGAASKAKKPRKTPSAAGGGGKRGPTHTTTSLIKRNPGTPSMDDIVPPITDVQYENAEALMTEFCKVPFLAEFSRPVSLLHPEVCDCLFMCVLITILSLNISFSLNEYQLIHNCLPLSHSYNGNVAGEIVFQNYPSSNGFRTCMSIHSSERI